MTTTKNNHDSFLTTSPEERRIPIIPSYPNSPFCEGQIVRLKENSLRYRSKSILFHVIGYHNKENENNGWFLCLEKIHDGSSPHYYFWIREADIELASDL